MSASGITVSGMFGPVLIGLVIAAMLSGITMAQMVTFMCTSKHHPLGHKLAVWFLWLLDLLHLSFMIHLIYHYLVSHFEDHSLVWTFPAHILIQLILMPTTQSFYVVRIWKLSSPDRRYVPLILGFIILANFAIGIFVSVSLFRCSTLEQAQTGPAGSEIPAVLVLTTCIDFCIAGLLGYSLSKANTNLSWTDSSCTMLLAYFVNTGAIVSFFSITVFATFLAAPQSLIFIALEAIATRLYVNSFLGMVNARFYFQPSKTTSSTALVLQSETSSHNKPIDRSHQRLSRTINEVGLPLFQHSGNDRNQDIETLEVTIKKEAYSSKI